MNRTSSRAALTLVALTCACTVVDTKASTDAQATGEGATYVPGPGDAWETRSPEQVGMDPSLLQDAIDYANGHETSMPRDPGRYLRERFEGLPHQEIVGPTRERGGVNGIVVRTATSSPSGETRGGPT